MRFNFFKNKLICKKLNLASITDKSIQPLFNIYIYNHYLLTLILGETKLQKRKKEKIFIKIEEVSYKLSSHQHSWYNGVTSPRS